MKKSILFASLLLLMLNAAYAQKDTDNANTAASKIMVNIKATGTGETTGHIADIKVKNTEDTPIKILPQTVYIPSDGQYQPYVADIPGTTVPPKGTVIIPMTGYCADIHKPPVGTGDGMPPIDTWITTTPIQTSNPTGTDFPIVTHVVPPFTPQDIPEIITTPGFTPNPTTKTTPIPYNIITTWPGTDIPVNGTIDPIAYPETFAPVIIDALKNISIAFDKLKAEGSVNTPFSGDAVKERESVIQQTFWIFTADITGDKYQKEHFAGKTIKQYEASTGTTVSTLPEPEKKKLDGGVDAFWNVFVLTGTEAKVLNEKQIPPSEKQHFFTDEGMVEIEAQDCGSIRGKVTTDPASIFKVFTKIVIYVTSSCEFCLPKPPYEQAVIKEGRDGMHPSFIIVPKDSTVTIMNTHEKEVDNWPNIQPSPVDDSRNHSIPVLGQGKSAVITAKRTSAEANEGSHFLIHDDIHKFYDAKMLVTPNQCYAIADKEGNYTIGKLPPGVYSLKVYTYPKRTNFAEGDVVVEAGKVSIRDFVLDRTGNKKEEGITAKEEKKDAKKEVE